MGGLCLNVLLLPQTNEVNIPSLAQPSQSPTFLVPLHLSNEGAYGVTQDLEAAQVSISR